MGGEPDQVMDTLARAYIRKGESREGAAGGGMGNLNEVVPIINAIQ